MKVQSSHKCWFALKSAVLGSTPSMPPLVEGCVELVCKLVGKDDLLSDHFNSRQSRESVDLPLTCHSSHSLTTFSFKLSEV